MNRVSYTMEFIFKASPAMLYDFMTNPGGLTRWFCDKVEISGDEFVFYWNSFPETAILIEDDYEERLRFVWDYSDEGEYWEWKMGKAEVTEETILEITDFCDEGDEVDSKKLWIAQIERLRLEIGG